MIARHQGVAMLLAVNSAGSARARRPGRPRAALVVATAAALAWASVPTAAAAETANWGGGPKSVTFDDGGISPAVCTLTLAVRREANNVHPTANVRCNASPGVVATIDLQLYVDNAPWTKKRFAQTNSASLSETLALEPGRVCIGAQGVKNSSLTGSNQVVLCGDGL
jgi:hypothetical protein